MATGNLILLTGSSGFVGFRTLRSVLAHGYSVRSVVRSQAKADGIRSNAALREATDSNLSFVIVPDLMASGAYNDVMDGVTHIVHVASPTPAEPGPGESLESLIVNPAIACTLEVLEAARKAGTVKRIVITSSVIANVPTDALMGAKYEQAFGPEYRAEEIPSPYMNHPMIAYAQSKIAALRRAEEWVAKNTPSFDVVHIHPTYVHGRDDVSRTLEDFSSGTNSALVNIALGKHVPQPRFMGTVHLDDVAEAHARALDPKIEGNQSFLLNYPPPEGLEWNSAKDFVAKHFPQAVEKGILPNNGSCPTKEGKVDSSKTEKVLGIKHKDFETQVASVIGHYLEVFEREKKAS